MTTTYYKDQYSCPCGHSFIIKVPVMWASTHLDEFNKILKAQEQAQYDHFFCTWVHEVKQFLKQPILIKVDMP